MQSSYLQPAAGQPTRAELEIKKSRFIAFVGHISDEESAREFILAIKKQFPTARHHCSAYIYHVDEAQPVERSSDDGEPSGTAGGPMLDVLRGSELLDVCAVVVRYFGGIKLGTGGLVRAYSQAVSEALASTPLTRRHWRQLVQFTATHTEAGRLEAELRGRGWDVADVSYAAAVTFTVALAPGESDRFAAELSALTQGCAVARSVGHTWRETPARA